MYIILNWSYIGDLTVVEDTDDMPKIFKDKEEALEFARKELKYNWKIVDLHEEASSIPINQRSTL